MSSPLRLFARSRLARSSLSAQRAYRTTALRPAPYRDSQDRNSLKPTSTEGTKSGKDDDVAANPDAAFNPSKTSPEEAERTAGVESNGNPLDASGANQGLSKPQGDERTPAKRGPGKETSKGGKSGSGSAPKGKDPRDV
ncbi:hypothetical protein S40285_06847 [Stachybotrys chlorohalonatus IBT 40285]|uniref:Uncharacterized protein n=1 Tax=Stachybotrys chlorohalonatus (strain IBT 40285) TaxID=1283841 RepID=A0A084QG92_STAC4|nr:hypothetical protein S40285_06847 [Stachybotrys chlorohalonata IBT 40285]